MRTKLAVAFIILLALGNLPSGARAEGISVEGAAPIVIPRESLEILPHGRTTGSVLENWITPMVFLTRWDQGHGLSEIITLGRLNGGIAKTWGSFSFEGNLYLDFTNAVANGDNLLNWFGAGARVLSEYRIASARTVLRLGGSHMPAKITSGLVEFLNRRSPSGSEYLWLDSDGDGLAADPELVLLSTTGGRYHFKAENLKRPFQDAVFLGFEKKIGPITLFYCKGRIGYFPGISWWITGVTGGITPRITETGFTTNPWARIHIILPTIPGPGARLPKSISRFARSGRDFI
jgi:hypothetical protein